MKFVMLRKGEGHTWEHVGAQDVAVNEDGQATSSAGLLVLPEVRAVEQIGRAGVYVAVPFQDWLLFEAEAEVIVKPVARPSAPAEAQAEPGERDGLETLDDDPDMEGMTQGPRRQ